MRKPGDWLQRVACLVGLLTAGTAVGAAISFDPIPTGTNGYAPGAVGTQGPTGSPIVGFTGTWSGNTGLVTAESAGLDAPNVVESGGSFKYGLAGYGDTARHVERSFTPSAMSEGDTLYFGGIVRTTSTECNNNFYAMATWSDDTNSAFRVGIGINWSDFAITFRERASGTTLDFPNWNANTDYHVVVEAIVNQGGSEAWHDTIRVWLNPTLDDVQNRQNIVFERTDISFVNDTDGFDTLTIASDGNQTSDQLDLYFDELVHTRNIADLNLVPEPSALLLLIAGATGVFRRRRA